jgi:hypothetical protein
MFTLFALVFYALRQNFAFAEKYPFAAVMEGPELLRFEEMQRGQKDSPILPVSSATVDHEPLTEIPESEVAAPDTPPPDTLPPLAIPRDIAPQHK